MDGWVRSAVNLVKVGFSIEYSRLANSYYEITTHICLYLKHSVASSSSHGITIISITSPCHWVSPEYVARCGSSGIKTGTQSPALWILESPKVATLSISVSVEIQFAISYTETRKMECLKGSTVPGTSYEFQTKSNPTCHIKLCTPVA